MTLNVGDILANRYRIVKLVGQGGFGAVYRAWDLSLKVPVAVKENLDTGPEAQRQFEHEAQLLAPLRHPNLPRVSDHFFVPDQGQYLVMDFVEGQSLAEVLAARGGPLNEAEALAWINQVCDALEYLHARNPPIIHRDIKPQNIIITAEGRAVLVDFGISKAYDPLLTTTRGARAVTPGYSPPEQYGMGKTDARSDVYALGATLYTLLTGQTPLESVALITGMETLLPVRQANPGVSTRTEAVIAAAMALSSSQRLGNATALRNALAGRAVVIPRPGPETPGRRVMPAPVWLGLVAIVAVVGVAVVLLLRKPPPVPPVVTPSGGTAIAEATGIVAAAPTMPATQEATPAVAAASLPQATNTAEPTATEPLPTATTRPREVAATIATPTPGAISCPGAFPTRLAVGDTARVATFQINVREGPGAAYSIVRRLDGNRTMEILDGPVCDDGQLWYYIRSEIIRPRNGSEPYQAEGWVAEESDDEYLIEPTD